MALSCLWFGELTVSNNHMKQLNSVEDISLDPKRVNPGTDRGYDLLSESMDQCGAGRSIVVDKHGVVINGNKALEIAKSKGMKVQVVPTDGQELVVVKRADLDLIEDPRARQLAYYDNRVQEVGLSWSPRQVNQDMLEGVELGTSFFPNELDAILELQPAEVEAQAPIEVPAVAEVAEPVEAVELPTAAIEPKVKEPKEPKAPKITYDLVFENYIQQVRWTGFVRQLRERYPDAGSAAERLSRYLADAGIPLGETA